LGWRRVRELVTGSRWLLNCGSLGYALGVHLTLGLPPADGLAVWVLYNLAALVLAAVAIGARGTFSLGLAALALVADVWRLAELLAAMVPSFEGQLLVRSTTLLLTGFAGVRGAIALSNEATFARFGIETIPMSSMLRLQLA
jgi:hypothetical protein